MKASHVGVDMRKALAQNPNLLRTLIGMGLTLIFLLSYAVYGATVSPSYYIYETDSLEVTPALNQVTPIHDSDENTTTWVWFVAVEPQNLTWVNLSATDLSEGADVTLSAGAAIASHPDLGNPDAQNFSCAVNCGYSTSHSESEVEGGVLIVALTNTDPARRGTGSIYAADLAEAKVKAHDAVNHTFGASQVKIVIIEQGNRTIQPSFSLSTVNEEITTVKQFEVEAATEFLWALAAVIGCFSIVLVPSLTVYIAARAKDKRNQVKLEKAKASLIVESE
jgi:hypothetical protein